MYSESWNRITSTIILNCFLLLDAYYFLKPNKPTTKDTFLKDKFPVPHLSCFSVYQSSTNLQKGKKQINLSRKSLGSRSTTGGLPFVRTGPPSLYLFWQLWHMLRFRDTAKPWSVWCLQNTQPGGGLCRCVEGCHHAPTSSLSTFYSTMVGQRKVCVFLLRAPWPHVDRVLHHRLCSRESKHPLNPPENTVSNSYPLLPFLPCFSIYTYPPWGMLRQLY